MDAIPDEFRNRVPHPDEHAHYYRVAYELVYVTHTHHHTHHHNRTHHDTDLAIRHPALWAALSCPGCGRRLAVNGFNVHDRPARKVDQRTVGAALGPSSGVPVTPAPDRGIAPPAKDGSPRPLSTPATSRRSVASPTAAAD
jgi:hypothetical protein